MTIGGTHIPPRVSTGDRYAAVRQVRWGAAVQTSVNCHCQLEKHPVGDVEPVKFIVQYRSNFPVRVINAAARVISGTAPGNKIVA